MRVPSSERKCLRCRQPRAIEHPFNLAPSVRNSSPQDTTLTPRLTPCPQPLQPTGPLATHYHLPVLRPPQFGAGARGAFPAAKGPISLAPLPQARRLAVDRGGARHIMSACVRAHRAEALGSLNSITCHHRRHHQLRQHRQRQRQNTRQRTCHVLYRPACGPAGTCALSVFVDSLAVRRRSSSASSFWRHSSILTFSVLLGTISR